MRPAGGCRVAGMETSICAWAPWWSEEKTRRFLSEVEGVVGARFGEYELDEAQDTVTVSDLDCVLGLSNLAQTCRQADPEEWRMLVYSHIGRLDDFSPEALSELLGDYERVRGDLRVRVVSPSHLNHIDPVGDPLPMGLFACLSVALDGATMPVDRGHFDEWGQDQGEVMAAALANTVAAARRAGGGRVAVSWAAAELRRICGPHRRKTGRCGWWTWASTRRRSSARARSPAPGWAGGRTAI